jgi:CheY-like chemotaxis protein
VLLVEDDHGDAFLVSELLREEAAPVELHRAQSLHEGLARLGQEAFDCVLLDLGLPDASGLAALERLREAAPHVAHLVLTGDRDDQRGIEAVAAGAQDYLVKGSVDGDGLRRAILYAVERRQADSVRQRLRAAEILAEEATRLERGLLPVPILNDAALLVGTGYRPGRERTLLGGASTTSYTRATARCTCSSATSVATGPTRRHWASACGWPGAR